MPRRAVVSRVTGHHRGGPLGRWPCRRHSVTEERRLALPAPRRRRGGGVCCATPHSAVAAGLEPSWFPTVAFSSEQWHLKIKSGFKLALTTFFVTTFLSYQRNKKENPFWTLSGLFHLQCFVGEKDGKLERKMKAGLLLESEISLTRFASPSCSFFFSFFFFFFHIFPLIHLHFSGSGVVGFFFFFFDSDVNGSSASRTVPPQIPRSHFLFFFFLFVSDVDASCVASLLPQIWRIQVQQHAQRRRLQLRRFLQPHLLAELNNPIELPDRRESVRAPSCRSLPTQTTNCKRPQGLPASFMP